ncbi:hypothetical protein PVAP13_9NG377300 [Panicum virgatum]|uniref:Uncharacterized protein n=1 Tax=Panicum virgatum TaxID=38727 RepID=A0A8T0MNJ3_PANVG|nr:hypothetical protein PVAP13_9NG377300 [Panicum virgatum]
MAIHTQPLAPPILMHVQLDPVVIYGVLKKIDSIGVLGFHGGIYVGRGAWKCRSGTSAHHQMIFSAIRSTCTEISWGYCWLESHVLLG